MINSAEEFVRLRISETMDDYLKAAWDDAPFEVWLEVIKKYPDNQVPHRPASIFEVTGSLMQNTECLVFPS
ncbi:hypothetical protein [Paenibacillus sp. SI8]|uniref:hypothetical protein n=1 Tax=unclassified Paenibacillus TaxID=185978 RepID=UPI00346653AF